jgi:hypothetical protein
LYTKVTIISKRRIMELERVKIDKSSLDSLLPQPIASKLGLSLHFGNSVIVKAANRTFVTNQYCRFTIKVANIKATIDACVVSELSSLLLSWEWTQQVNLLSDLGNHTYYIPGPRGNLNKLPDLAPAARAEAETEFATGAVVMREETTENCKWRRSEEYELRELASVDESTSGDETISDATVFEDTVSSQSSDDDLYYVDRILAEKQEDESTYYLILWDGYTEDKSTWEPQQNIMDKELLDVWKKRKMQEFYGMEPAFDLVKFEERQKSTLMHPVSH